MRHSFEEKFIDTCVLVMVAVFAAFAFFAVLQEVGGRQEVEEEPAGYMV